ncbi:MAG: redoxin domain-containing protein [Acidobacteria bacterium]|nr:redoxin domain-containing protein [Acidobacteriota bacterium]
MRPALAKHAVSVIALSKDTVDEVAIHKQRDGLTLTLLADPELEVIRQYGVEHHKVLGFSTGSLMLGGIPLGPGGPSFKTMAIPTSLLVDEDGRIVWIDQADDYRLRSSNGRVLGAVETAFSSES